MRSTSVVGSPMSCLRASSTTVAGRRVPSTWQCSSTFGTRRRYSRYSKGMLLLRKILRGMDGTTVEGGAKAGGAAHGGQGELLEPPAVLDRHPVGADRQL